MMSDSEQPTEKWIKLARGIRCREHPTRRHGPRKDRYFVLRFSVDKKTIQEGLGWASEGMTLEKARLALAEIKEALRTGTGHRSLTEKREAAEEKRQFEAEQKELEARAAITLREFWDTEYLPSAKASKKPSTIQSEKHLFANWIAPAFGHIPLRQIDAKSVEQLARSAQQAGKRPATIRYILAVISQIWNKALALDVVNCESPTRKVKKPSEDNRRMRFLTREEAEALLKALAAKSIDTHDSALLSLLCGLRAGEIHSLTWGDVDFYNKTIAIRDTKSKKNRFDFLITEVEEMLKRRFSGTSKQELVFPATHGGQRRWISDSFSRVVDELGLNDTGEFIQDDHGKKSPLRIKDARQRVVFHSLRHTFASWLVQDGTPLYTVAELMGHSTLEMTKRYAHLAPDILREAALRLKGKISPAQAKSTGKGMKHSTDILGHMGSQEKI